MSIESEARAAVNPFGNDFPEHAPGKVSPIPAALEVARDRMARTDNALGNLEHVLDNLVQRLGPVLTDGNPNTYPADPPLAAAVGGPEDVDTRSTIARSIAELAALAGQQGDYVDRLIARVHGITAAVEA